MAWKIYHVRYELHSPIHIGYHKVGNVQRTRYYIPGRNPWGAITEALTRHGFGLEVLKTSSPDDYSAVGNWIKEHCAFGYWFVREGEQWLTPCYAEGELRYGNLTTYQFEQRYLCAHVTTALDAATTSAEEGSLHEVEFIAPYGQNGVQTHLGGWVFLDDEAQKKLQWSDWLDALQIGGERRYGFGRLRLVKFEPVNESNWQLDQARPRIRIERGKPLLAHTLYKGVQARGQIEPLVGRETQDSSGFGMSLRRAQICWVPGSLLLEDAILQLEQEGYWTKAK